MDFLSQENSLIIITLFGIVQGIVLSLLVFFYPERDKNSNTLLAVFIFTATIILLAPILQHLLGWKFVWIFHCIKFITISSLYLYIRSLSVHISRVRVLKHFSFAILYIPIAVHYVHYIGNKYNVKFAYEGGKDPYDTIIALSNLVYIAFYFALYFKAYREHQSIVFSNFSSLHKLGLKWIRQLIFGFMIIVFVSYALFAYSLSAPEFSTMACLLSMSVISTFLYVVTIKGKISPEIYKLRTLLAEQMEHNASGGKAVNASKKQAEDIESISLLEDLADQVRSAMEKDEFYRNENASVKELAEAINAQPYLVSQSINKILGKSFFEIVNEYRVQHAKKLLADPEFNHLSLVGIGFESGFNSKTTFNTTFKKITGQTPSEFKRTEIGDL